MAFSFSLPSTGTSTSVGTNIFSTSAPQQQQQQQQHQPQHQPQPSSSLFGPPKSTLFGNSFPSSTATSTPGTFNSSGIPSFGVGLPSMQQQQQQQPTLPSNFATHPFQYIQECFQPTSANYRFRTFFYNQAPAQGIGFSPSNQQGSASAPPPPPNVTQSLWDQVLSDNPDPKNMIPIMANGFSDLQARQEWQQQISEAQITKLKELEERTSLLIREQQVGLSSHIQLIKGQQQKLTLLLLNIMKKVEHSPSPLTEEERALFSQIQNLQNRLSSSSSSHLSPALIKSLIRDQQAINSSPHRTLDPLYKSRSMVVSGAGKDDLISFLAEQQQSITSLNGIIDSELKKVL